MFFQFWMEYLAQGNYTAICVYFEVIFVSFDVWFDECSIKTTWLHCIVTKNAQNQQSLVFRYCILTLALLWNFNFNIFYKMSDCSFIMANVFFHIKCFFDWNSWWFLLPFSDWIFDRNSWWFLLPSAEFQPESLMAVGMASNLGHHSRTRRSKIFSYGRRLQPTVQHWKFSSWCFQSEFF